MQFNLFSILKEINSLEHSLFKLYSVDKEEEKRIKRLNEHKELKKDELKELLETKVKLNNELTEIDQKTEDITNELKNISKQENEVLSETIQKRLQDKKQNLESELNLIQDQGLTYIEELEDKEETIKELQGFLNGIDSTIEEIKKEVYQLEYLNLEKASIVRNRIDECLNELPKNEKESYLKLKSKAPSLSTLSIVNNAKCSHCYFEIHTSKLNELKKEKLISCSACNRILIL